MAEAYHALERARVRRDTVDQIEPPGFAAGSLSELRDGQ